MSATGAQRPRNFPNSQIWMEQMFEYVLGDD
jgi:hypothetical protein